MGTPPIIPQDYLSGVTVIDIGDARVSRGMSRRPVTACKHSPLVYDQMERRVWCRDCESDVEPFDAFLILVEQFARAANDIQKRREKLEEAEQHNIIRVAAKRLDEMFRSTKMVPACPHCRAGIFPEDVAKMGRVNREWEQAKRNRKDTHP